MFKFIKSIGAKIAKAAKSVGKGVAAGAKTAGKAIAKAAAVTGKAIGATAVVTWNAIVTAAVVAGKAIAKAAVVTGSAIAAAAVVTASAIKTAAIVSARAIAKVSVIAAKKIAEISVIVAKAVAKAAVVTAAAIKVAAIATAKALRISAIATGKAIVVSTKATGKFLSTPLGISTTLIGALTVTSGIMLTSNLMTFFQRDEHEVALKSDLNTGLELFSVQYKNESGDIIVSGADGEKVIAPGTSVDYTFRLRNADKIALDYRLIPNISFTSEYKFPIVFRMIDDDGYYTIGSATEWATVDEIGTRLEFGDLKKGESDEFIFSWKWDYEGDDLLDTEIGNLATTEKIGVNVGFTLEAEANTDIQENSGVMESGLGEIIYKSAAVAASAAAVTLLIVFMAKKKRKS